MNTDLHVRVPVWARLLLLLAIPSAAPAAMTFESPLSGTPRSDWFIINFVDHGDGTTPLDYAGGRQTYPTHTGMDIMLYDFMTMDEGIDVLAAALGTVLACVDGLDDRVLEGQPNRIFLRHADGSVSYYAHLKMHSILVATGQVVAAGQKMAEVGADGTNEVAHLHFGVRNDYSTNGIWCEIMTNQCGLAQSFDWFDTYSDQVICQVYGMGVTHTNDPVFAQPAWRQQQTPSSYTVMNSGPFCVWIKYTGRHTNDFLAIRLLSVSGPGATIDFSSCGWYVANYVIYHCPVWESLWRNFLLSNGTTYKLQYQWNGGEWRDGPGANTLLADDSLTEVFLSRFSPGHTNVPAPPAALTATGGTRTNSVRLEWTAAERATRYCLYRGPTDDFGLAMPIAATSNTGYDDTNAAPETSYYYWVEAVNPRGAGEVSNAAAGWRAMSAGVGPVVRINNYHQPPALAACESVRVTVQLNPGDYAGIDADWWALADTPLGWHIFAAGQWRPLDVGLSPAYQGPLFDLPPCPILDGADLPSGSYVFYFGVDLRDDRLNLDQIWYDAVPVIIRP